MGSRKDTGHHFSDCSAGLYVMAFVFCCCFVFLEKSESEPTITEIIHTKQLFGMLSLNNTVLFCCSVPDAAAVQFLTKNIPQACRGK